jgi:large subunit ribosomal protein L24
LNEQYGNQRTYSPFDLPIPFDDVRLVVALDDPATGNVRDVLVEHVYGGEPFLERIYGSSIPKHTRYISGEDIEIPWPREENLSQRDEPRDTLRMEVETPTWIPSLINPPFESSVLDELRNKFSKYRTRHDSEWIEAKKIEDYRQEYLRSRTLLTPKGELRAKILGEKEQARKANLDADGNIIMDKETISFVERFMQESA